MSYIAGCKKVDSCCGAQQRPIPHIPFHQPNKALHIPDVSQYNLLRVSPLHLNYHVLATDQPSRMHLRYGCRPDWLLLKLRKHLRILFSPFSRQGLANAFGRLRFQIVEKELQ